ncbi:MAG: SsrA-binding protein SmpB [Clostridia bacterium]|nr:SsrA-binding protein SmpB [Clostridia bacterium]
MAKKKGVKPIAQNKKARHDYFIEESLECGIELKGTEVKSMRQGKVNLKESYAQVKDGEIFVQGMHISPYEQGNIFNTDPLRPKRLLLHKSEIRKLGSQVQRQGYTLIPLDVYLKDGRMKLTLGLCAGKHMSDKRASMAERDMKRDLARRVRTNNREDG